MREVKRICTAVKFLPRDKRTHQLSWISVMGSCAVQLTERNMWTFIPRSTLRESRKLQNRQGQSILVQTKNVLLTMITSWEQMECDDIMRVRFSFIRLGTFTVYKTHIILSTAMPQLWNKTTEIEYSPSFHGYHNIFPWREVFISKLPSTLSSQYRFDTPFNVRPCKHTWSMLHVQNTNVCWMQVCGLLASEMSVEWYFEIILKIKLAFSQRVD